MIEPVENIEYPRTYNSLFPKFEKLHAETM